MRRCRASRTSARRRHAARWAAALLWLGSLGVGAQGAGASEAAAPARDSPHGAVPSGVAAPECAQAQAGALALGFTLTHLAVDVAAEPSCRAKGGSGATIRAQDNIIVRYDDPAVRERVRAMLRQMHAQGASVLRTNLWFRHAEDRAFGPRARDPLGLMVASAGALPGRYLSQLERYLLDARQAGFEQFILVAGVQGRANPRCRAAGGEWGSCYEADLTPLSFGVVEQVVAHLQRSDLEGLKLIFDIAPSTCAPSDSARRVDRQLMAYARFMVKSYRERFGDRRFIASCGGNDARRAERGLAAQSAMYRALGVLPAAMDLHIYVTDRDAVTRLIDVAQREASGLGVPLIIGETYFDHPNVFDTLRTQRGRWPALGTLLVWPRLEQSACHFSVAPPYALAPIVQRLGGLGPVCATGR